MFCLSSSFTQCCQCLLIVHSWLTFRFSLIGIWMNIYKSMTRQEKPYIVRVMMFNGTFNKIPVISWRWVLLVGETGVPREIHWPVACYWQTVSHHVVSNTPRHKRESNSQLAQIVVNLTTIRPQRPLNNHINTVYCEKKKKNKTNGYQASCKLMKSYPVNIIHSIVSAI